MQRPRPHSLIPLVCALAGTLLLAGGCPATISPPALEPIDKFDFARLKTLVDTVNDVNDASLGLQSIDALYATYAGDGTRFEFVELEQLGFAYAVLTEPEGQTQTVFLAGTTSLAALELDMQIEPAWDDELGIALHGGFRTTALLVRDDVLPRLDPNHSLRLVGYSLGGASATILGLYLTQAGLDVQEIVTLGQPMFTNAEGAAAFAELPLLRLIAGDDVFPRLRSQDYVQFGEALILLDGPYVVHLLPEKPDIDLATSLAIESSDAVLLDHFSYRWRMASKVGVDVLEVAPGEMQAYLDRPAVPE